METAGLFMLAAVTVGMIGTGLPAFVVLIAVALVFGCLGMVTGDVPWSLLTALPLRLVGLLESDVLQALPLYVFMGALLHRLPLAERLFRSATAAFGRMGAAPALAGLLLGGVLAPMNGSVGASVATLARVVHPRLRARGVDDADNLAIISAASTLGVIVPPSLVLILFGDTMMRAHTEAQNVTRGTARIINTQDMFHGALIPAALLLLCSAGIIWWRGRRVVARPEEPVGPGDWIIGGATLAFVGGLLAAVATGWLYAVEAAAFGGVALCVYGIATRSLDRTALDPVLRTTLVVTGALFALFVGATGFSLVLRAFGTDHLLAAIISGLPGGAVGAMLAVLLLLGLCALVLDAFEIILVVIPVVMPPGQSATQRTPWFPKVAAMLALSPTRPCFDAVYAAPARPPRTPASDAMLTMTPPPCATIFGTTRLQSRYGPVRFTSNTRRHSSSVTSSTSASRSRMPALLTSTSRRSPAAATIRSASSPTATLATIVSTDGCAAFRRSSASPSMSTARTSAPARRNRSTMSAPAPFAPPVMTVRRPDRSMEIPVAIRGSRHGVRGRPRTGHGLPRSGAAASATGTCPEPADDPSTPDAQV